MEKIKKTKTKRKAVKKPRVIQEVPIKEPISFGRILTLVFKVITLPFYMVYALLFKIPTEGPAPILGLLRFVFFSTITVLMTQNHNFDDFIENFVDNNRWIPISSTTALGVIGAIMLINMLLSFKEIFGYSTGAYYDDVDSELSKNTTSGYSAIDEGLDYRDSLLSAKHTPGKIKELKKTGFITKERLSSMGSSSEVNKALELLNSQMSAMHSPDKLKTLEGMFGGK